MQESITILHTNDLHSHFEFWPQIRRFLTGQKQQLSSASSSCYVVDIGDHVDRVHPFTEGTKGRGNVELLNHAGYDVVTIGNNEGITFSHEDLQHLYDEATFEVVVANLFTEDGQRPIWSLPFTIRETDLGTRIGFIGATAPFTSFYAKLNWLVTNPFDAIEEQVHNLREKVDVLVVLSHLGLQDDRLLAKQCPQIDVILGAHTHHLLPQGEKIGNTLLAATGKFGQYVGEVTLEMCGKQLQLATAIVHSTSEMEQLQMDIEEVQQLVTIGKRELDVPVFYNSTSLPSNLFGESELSSFFGRALIAHTNVDCAMFNAGLFLGSLPKGWVTKGDLHRLLPHPINLCRIELSGEQLQEVYQLATEKEWAEIEVRGLGFRGTLMGAMLFERLFVNSNGKLFAGNKEVVRENSYSFITLDMFTFGYFFPLLKDLPKDYLLPEFIRDVIGEYGKNRSKFSQSEE